MGNFVSAQSKVNANWFVEDIRKMRPVLFLAVKNLAVIVEGSATDPVQLTPRLQLDL